MNGCFSRFLRTDLTLFPDLYQLVLPFVKGVLRRNLRSAVIGSLLWTLGLTVFPLQQVCCLTAEEIAYLKKAGVSEETIRLMIEQENRRELQSQTGIWEVEDEQGRPSTLYRVGGDEDDVESRRVEQEKVDRAWEMLRNLVIDARENPKTPYLGSHARLITSPSESH